MENRNKAEQALKKLETQRDELKDLYDKESNKLKDSTRQLLKQKTDLEDISSRLDDAQKELQKADKARKKAENDLKDVKKKSNRFWYCIRTTRRTS